MRTQKIGLIVVLFLISGISIAQKTYKEMNENSILLKSGKYIENIQIRRFDSLKVEYIKRGNLCDILISEISEIVTDSGTVTYTEGRIHFSRESDDKENAPEPAVMSDFKATDSLLVHNQGTGSYYINSYHQGVETARKEDVAGWGVGTFLMGCIYGSPYLVSIATSTPVDDPKVPAGVDPNLFTEGYKQQKTIERAKSAATGSTIAKAIVTGFFLLVIGGLLE